MADITINQVTTISFLGTGSNLASNFTNLGSYRAAQVEAPGVEMARSGRSFVGGTSAAAGGIASVTNLPTTAAPWVLYNSQPLSQASAKCLVVKRLSAFFCSSTINATSTGFSIFAGVTVGVLVAAQIPAVNSTNHKTQATRGFGTPFGIVAVSTTIPDPVPPAIAWRVLGGVSVLTAAATVGPSYTVDISSNPYIVQPGYALAAGVIADNTGTPLWGMSFAWDEVEMTLP